MAHLTPAVDSFRARAAQRNHEVLGGSIRADVVTAPNMSPTRIPVGLDEATNDLALAMAASRRKGSRAAGHSNSPTRNANGEMFGRDKSPADRAARDGRGTKGIGNGNDSSSGGGGGDTSEANGDDGSAAAASAPGGDGGGGGVAGKDDTMQPSTPTTGGRGDGLGGGDGGGGGSGDGVDYDDGAVEVKDYESRCCCACWDSFAFWLDQRNTQNNLPVFRLLYFSATVVYFAVILGVAAGGIKRGYATAVVGVSFASVCSHWLISIEHPTSTMEAVHLLLHACTEAISVLLWVSVR
ncbi:unnamed protein product [Laminaria digitata]